MRLSDLQPNNPTASCKLVHPLGSPCDVVLHLISKDTGEAKSYAQFCQDRRLREISKTGRTKLTAAEMEEDAKEILARCIHSWEGLLDEDEKNPLALTLENKKAVLATPWIYKQVDEFVAEDSNFFRL